MFKFATIAVFAVFCIYNVSGDYTNRCHIINAFDYFKFALDENIVQTATKIFVTSIKSTTNRLIDVLTPRVETKTCIGPIIVQIKAIRKRRLEDLAAKIGDVTTNVNTQLAIALRKIQEYYREVEPLFVALSTPDLADDILGLLTIQSRYAKPVQRIVCGITYTLMEHIKTLVNIFYQMNIDGYNTLSDLNIDLYELIKRSKTCLQ